MNNTNTPVAVVVGHDHQNTLGVIRSLGEGGLRVKAVILSDGGSCSTAHSKYIDEAMIVREKELIDTLGRLGEQLEGRVPLIPCGDDSAIPVAQNHSHLEKWYYLPGAGANTLRLMKKTAMLEAARAAGLLVPDWVALGVEEYPQLEQRCALLRFPCILKPVDLLKGGTFEFRILRTMEELLDCMEYITGNCASIIVQEFVEKTAEFGVNACRLYRSGKTVFGGVIEKKRFSQASLGSTTAGTILPDTHGLCDAAKRFVEHIDYRGIFDMEFITDGENFYFVEMNFRNGGYGYAYTKAGRNYPAIWASEALGEPTEPYLRKPAKTVFFINESADLQNVRAGKLSMAAWLADVLRAKAHMYINHRDMKPLMKKIMGK